MFLFINKHRCWFFLSMFKTHSCFVSPYVDPLGSNVDDVPHQNSHQNRSRRGRNRNSNDRSLSSNSSSYYHYGHFNQDFTPPFRHDVSNYALYEQQPHYHEHDGSRHGGRGRGRGRRVGNRGVNGNFGGSTSRQRPGGDFGSYSGNNQVEGASHPGPPPRGGPNRANWRRTEENRSEQTTEDQDAEAKKPRKFHMERRRQHHYEKENSAREGGQRSGDAKEDTQRAQSASTGPDFQRGAKRRHGSIKPPKGPGTGSDGTSREQTDPCQGRASVEEPSEAGHSSERHTPQTRGRRRTHQQNHRPTQRKWDKMPGSKESQTGESRPV